MCIFQKLGFQILFFLSLYKFFAYLNKISSDINAVYNYWDSSDILYVIVSISALAVPSLYFAFYNIGIHLIDHNNLYPSILLKAFVYGLLLIPWQVKCHLDTLYYSMKKLCVFEIPIGADKRKIEAYERQAEMLEFFEDFFAGFIQLTFQTYLLMLEFESSESVKDKPRDFLLWSMASSAMSCFSLMIAARRRDDGIGTKFFSFLGWMCMFGSRVTLISLVINQMHFWLIGIEAIFVLITTIWVYLMAIYTHPQGLRTHKKIGIFIISLITFGIPSITFWPIMFQFRKWRTIIFLSKIIIETVLILTVWAFLFQGWNHITETEMVTLKIIIALTFVGWCSLLLYDCIKPKSEIVALDNMRAARREQREINYGIYYEFHDNIFVTDESELDNVHDMLMQIRTRLSN